ncbi:MAG TPA: DUF2231 domain-containing protein [Blastocatellia bacterium]|nr:DUF2231 domain-containing protein [Blastocatellia bacterium]
MESKAKLLGHPIHPMLIVFPLGLLTMAVIFDLIALSLGNGYWSGISYYLIAAGVIGGLLAALFGLIDWVAIPRGTRAKSIGLVHGLGNVAVMGLFIVSWLMRREMPESPSMTAILLGLIGLGLALITSWLGGELVDRLGVGVDNGAHLNAPNSLSGRPASEDASHIRTMPPTHRTA